MYLPSLLRDRDKFIIVQKYNARILAGIIFLYLTDDISNKDIEIRVLNNDFKGYRALDILKYYGLKREHHNIFNNVSYKNVKASIGEKVYEDNEYETLYLLLNSVTFEMIERNYSKDNRISSKFEIETKHYGLNFEEINSLPDEEKEAYFNVIAKIRNKKIQDKFRKSLLDEFNCKCALCEIDKSELLIASHIVPYSKCEGLVDKAGDSNNGLLLCPIHDALFESGRFISFDAKGEIIISGRLSDSDFYDYNLSKSIILDAKYMTERRKKYLLEHNKYFFERN